MADVYPPDYTTPIGRVRSLIPDTEQEDGKYLFDDAAIEGLLAVYGDSVKGAAAAALNSIASNEVLFYKYVRTDDLLVDGTKAADLLFKRAARLEEEAGLESVVDDFVIVYPNWTQPSFEYQERSVRDPW